MKWAGFVASVMLLVVWIGSGWFSACWAFPSRLYLEVEYGFMEIDYTPFRQVAGPPTGWNFDTHPFWLGWRPSAKGRMDTFMISLPLWIPELCTVILTATAWRLDTLARRRAHAGACRKCGYSLTGLAPGAACPECGHT